MSGPKIRMHDRWDGAIKKELPLLIKHAMKNVYVMIIVMKTGICNGKIKWGWVKWSVWI